MTSVYLFGTFDVANYGDLLFPLLVDKRLAPLGMNIVPVSPMGGEAVWGDCFASISVDAISTIEPPDTVLIGGGNIISLMPTVLPAYAKGTISLFGYPDLWIGASHLASDGVPICWNSPGVPEPFKPDKSAFIRDCLIRSSYLSVRDQESRQLLLEVFPDAQISVIPDSAWDLPNLWTSDELSDGFQQAFMTRDRFLSEPHIAVHLNKRYLTKMSTQRIAAILDKISRKMNAGIVLLAIGPCHGDSELIQLVGRQMATNPLVIDEPRSLKEIAACIAYAQAYIGSSMHGLITAASFSVPSLCVMPRQMTKFDGLKRLLDNEQIWLESWKDVLGRLQVMNFEQEKIRLSELVIGIRKKLDLHWETVIHRMQQGGEQGEKNCPDNSSKKQYNASFLAYRSGFAAIEAIRNIQLNKELKKQLINPQVAKADLKRIKNLIKRWLNRII